jgi:cell wall assembly regulator SMI1
MMEIWDQLERQLLAHAPSLMDSFRSATNVEALDAYEKEAGIRLPTEVRRAYLRHDGNGGDDNRPSLGLFGYYRWLSLTESLEQLHFNLQNFDEGDPYHYDERDLSWSTLPIRPWQSVPPHWRTKSIGWV